MSFIRQHVTIPAAGVVARIRNAGYAVTVESVPIYGVPDDVPLLSFETNAIKQPCYNQSVYTAGACGDPRSQFNEILIHGTTESEGDEIYLLVHDSWTEQKIEPLFSRVLLDETQTQAVTDAAVETIPEALHKHSDGKAASAVLLTFEGETRVSFNVDPTTAVGHLMADGSQLYVEGFAFIAALRMIATGAGGSVVTYTIEY